MAAFATEIHGIHHLHVRCSFENSVLKKKNHVDKTEFPTKCRNVTISDVRKNITVVSGSNKTDCLDPGRAEYVRVLPRDSPHTGE